MATQKWIEENREKMREYRRKWYRENKTHAKKKVNERRTEIKSWARDIRSKLKCQNCHENHPACLEFHHLDPTQKETTISLATCNGWSKERILEEMKKCIVLCSNCHGKLHYNNGANH